MFLHRIIAYHSWFPNQRYPPHAIYCHPWKAHKTGIFLAIGVGGSYRIEAAGFGSFKPVHGYLNRFPLARRFLGNWIRCKMGRWLAILRARRESGKYATVPVATSMTPAITVTVQTSNW